jgi:alkaline phosphatase D
MTSRRTFLHGCLTTLLIAGSKITAAFGRTLPAGKSVSRIAFGSCAQQWLPQSIWNAIGETRPDVFLFLGDAIYGDWDGKQVFTPTLETLKRDWDLLAAIPEFAKFRSTVPIMATWDNHDYGKHDGGAEFTLKEKSKKLFLDIFDEPENSARRERPGIYDAKIFGPEGKRLQIILLDTRTFKSGYIKDKRPKEEKAALNIRGQYLPNTNPKATLLGDLQWAWLVNQLRKPADVRLIASSTQVIADEKAMEEWGNFPLQRKRLFDVIAKTGAKGVVLLSGNVHYAEISASDEGPYPIHDFTSSGMTHNNPGYATLRNRRRVAGPFTKFNFGLVEIDWDHEDGPRITMNAKNADGHTAFTWTIALSGLRSRS